MHDRARRFLWTIVLAIALCALFAYRPLLVSLGYDLEGLVPSWADFLTPVQYRLFLSHVEGYFRDAGVAVRLENGAASTEDGGVYALRPLAQRCRQAERGTWRRLVQAYFDELRGTGEEKPVPAKLPRSRKPADGMAGKGP